MQYSYVDHSYAGRATSIQYEQESLDPVDEPDIAEENPAENIPEFQEKIDYLTTGKGNHFNLRDIEQKSAGLNNE